MPRKKKGSGSGMPAGFGEVVSGTQDWNNRFVDSYGDSTAWSQGNPYADAALPWIQQQFSGDMSANPWMRNLYGNVADVNMDESMAYLRDFLGGPPSGQGGVGGGNGGGGKSVYGNTGGSSRRTGSASGGGTAIPNTGGGARGVPDSTVGSGWFSENIHDLFDPSRLDPANDPTMRPMVDAFQNESEESYYRSLQDLTNQMEGAGRYGSGSYQLARTAANEEYNEAVQNQLAQLYGGAREAALGRQMDALGLVNTRDIAAGQIAAQERAAAMAARSASSSQADQMELARQQLRLQGISQMMQGQQYGLGMQGDMAQLMQQGQLGAGQLGLGFGQLGQSGFADAANFGQLGMGAMQNLGGIYGNAAQIRAQQQRAAEEQRRWNEGAPLRDLQGMIGMMSGLNELGGYGMQPGYVPTSPGAEPSGFNWGDALGGIFTGLGTYNNWGK